MSLGSEAAGFELPVLCVFLNMDLWIFTSLHPFIVSEFVPSGFTSCFIVKFRSLCDCFASCGVIVLPSAASDRCH